MHRAARFIGLLVLLAGGASSVLAAQCPDGSPPPCHVARRPAPHYDSATAIVVPLRAAGTDSTLRRIGDDITGIIAQNLNAGEIHGLAAVELRNLPLRMLDLAREEGAGAIVYGSLFRQLGRIHIVVQMQETKHNTFLADLRYESSPDSLQLLADRASLALLKAWWRAQPGPWLRSGLTTDSLRALRYYIEAMTHLRRSAGVMSPAMDSAARADPSFLAPWIWLSLPSEPAPSTIAFARAIMGQRPGGIGPDSAAAQVRRLVASGSDQADYLKLGLPAPQFIADLAAGGQALIGPGPVAARCSASLNLFGGFAAAPEYNLIRVRQARLLLLAGCPSRLVIDFVNRAWLAAPEFTPTRWLLLELLVDAGDTAGARAVLNHAPALPATFADSWQTQIALRFGPVRSGDEAAELAQLYPLWHRFQNLPNFDSTFATAAGNASPAAMAAISATSALPRLVATGRFDSARVVFQTLKSSIPLPAMVPQIANTGLYLGAMMGGGLPPDTSFFPSGADSLSLMPYVAMISDASPMRRAISSPMMMRTLMAAFHDVVVHTLFAAGVIDVERGDTATARWAADRLDSLGRTDTTFAGTYAATLRADMALALNDGPRAESLLFGAVNLSLQNSPARARWLLARRYADSGRPEAALALARSITVSTRLHGGDNTTYYASALLLEAEMLERLGRRDEAAQSFRDFVALRQDADPALQADVVYARQHLASLVP